MTGSFIIPLANWVQTNAPLDVVSNFYGLPKRMPKRLARMPELRNVSVNFNGWIRTLIKSERTYVKPQYIEQLIVWFLYMRQEMLIKDDSKTKPARVRVIQYPCENTCFYQCQNLALISKFFHKLIFTSFELCCCECLISNTNWCL